MKDKPPVKGLGSPLSYNRTSHIRSHFTHQEITDYRAVRAADADLLHRVYLALLNHGIFLASRGMGCLSTPMTSAEVDAFVEATDHALDEASRE